MTKKVIWPVIDEVETTEEDTDELDTGLSDIDGTFDNTLWGNVGQNISFSNSGNLTTVGYVNSQINANPTMEVSENTTTFKGALVLKTENGDEMDIGATLETIGERLLVLQADFEAHEEYPALKDAYDQYKMLEKLLKGGKNAKED